eukprot:5259277-Prymnesium_polylepis.1
MGTVASARHARVCPLQKKRHCALTCKAGAAPGSTVGAGARVAVSSRRDELRGRGRSRALWQAGRGRRRAHVEPGRLQ